MTLFCIVRCVGGADAVPMTRRRTEKNVILLHKFFGVGLGPSRVVARSFAKWRASMKRELKPPMAMRLAATLRPALPAFFATMLFAGPTSMPMAGEGAIGVVASIKPAHSLVSAVMEGTGEPHLLIQGATSPHTFSLRPSDAVVLQNARLVFLIDERVETSLTKTIDTLARDARIVMLSEAEGLVHRPLREGGAFETHGHDVEEHHGRHHEEEGHPRERDAHGHETHDAHGRHGDERHGSLDMHVWLDPVNAGAMARRIARALSEVDPANAETYAANVETLRGRLDDLIAETAKKLTPARGRPFIVFHDAYIHFEDRFGLTAAGSVVVSVDRSPGARRVTELRDKIRRFGSTCVFAEVQFDSRLVDTIIEDTQARAGVLDPLGSTVKSGPDAYFDLIRNMAESFKACLAPEGHASGAGSGNEGDDHRH